MTKQPSTPAPRTPAFSPKTVKPCQFYRHNFASGAIYVGGFNCMVLLNPEEPEDHAVAYDTNTASGAATDSSQIFWDNFVEISADQAKVTLVQAQIDA